MGAAPWLMWLLAGLLPHRPGLHPMPVYVRLLVNELALGHFISQKKGDLKNFSVCSILFSFYPFSYVNILYFKFGLVKMQILTDLLFIHHN